VLSATRNRDGVLIGFAKITRDLSERKRAAEEMAERARQQSVAAELGLYALQTAQLDRVIERSMQTVRETLQIDDVRILRAGESPLPGARTVRIHARNGRGVRLFGGIRLPPLTANDVKVPASRRKRGGRRDGAEPERGAAAPCRTRSLRGARQERPHPGGSARARRVHLRGCARAADALDRAAAQAPGLESSGGLLPPKGERLGAAVRQTERLARLIDRLLDVSRIAQGRVEMTPEIFDLAVLVRQVAEDFREASNAGARGCWSCNYRRRSRDRGIGCGSNRCW